MKKFLFALILTPCFVITTSSLAYGVAKRHRKHRALKTEAMEARVPASARPPKTFGARPQPALLPLAPASDYGLNAESVKAYTIREGQDYAAVLQNLRFERREINSLITSRVIPTHTFFAAGERYLVTKSKKGKRTEVKFYLPHVDEALIFVKGGHTTDVQRIAVSYTKKLKVVNGTVVTYLAHDIKKSINNNDVYSSLQDAFAFDLDLSEKMTRGSKYAFIVEERYDHGQFINYGDITDAKITVDGIEHQRTLKVSDVGKFYFNPTGNYDSRSFFAPVRCMKISSPFTLRRFHPVKHNYQPHLGVDFADAEGTPVMAARAGEVAEVGYRRANGNFIVLKHDDGYTTYYNHLADISTSLQPGGHVNAGEVIGSMGCTGYCSGTHLDFRIKRGDTLYNPVYLIRPYPAPAQQLVEQQARLTKTALGG